MVPDGLKSQNLPNPVRTLAVILHYPVKNEIGIKVSIAQTAKLFCTQEKLFHQALKGVQYEYNISTQKCRHLDATHGKKEESSSSETENNDDYDDNKDKGAFARIKPLKACKK